MAKYKLIFSPEFTNDLSETFEYISKALSNETAAKKLMREIDNSIMRLRETPEMCPILKQPLGALGYRKLVIKNYVIIYSVNIKTGNICLLRCFYGRQDYLRYFE